MKAGRKTSLGAWDGRARAAATSHAERAATLDPNKLSHGAAHLTQYTGGWLSWKAEI